MKFIIINLQLDKFKNKMRVSKNIQKKINELDQLHRKYLRLAL